MNFKMSTLLPFVFSTPEKNQSVEKSTKVIDLSGNSINNKEKILNHMKDVEFKFSSLY